VSALLRLVQPAYDDQLAQGVQFLEGEFEEKDFADMRPAGRGADIFVRPALSQPIWIHGALTRLATRSPFWSGLPMEVKGLATAFFASTWTRRMVPRYSGFGSSR